MKRRLLSTLFLILPLLAAGPVRAQTELDRATLPIPEPTYPPITELDARKAKAPPRFEVKAPANAPNVVIVLLDDFGFGAFSDRGTNLDAVFALPPGTLGFAPDFMKIFSKGKDEPEDGGQYGLAVRAFIPELNSAEFGAYFLNYHSRFALINGFTADQAAIDATSSATVAARAATLAPIYEAEGLSPEQAAQRAQAAAETLTIGTFANATRYFATYPENIKLLGFSFNTALLRTGTLFSGEISHHLGFPVQLPVEQVLAVSLSPIQFTPVFTQTPLGAFGADTVVRGFMRRDKTQLEVGVTQLLGPRLRSSQTVLGFDIGWVHIHNLPASHPSDEDSWGYRLIGQLTYDGVLAG